MRMHRVRVFIHIFVAQIVEPPPPETIRSLKGHTWSIRLGPVLPIALARIGLIFVRGKPNYTMYASPYQVAKHGIAELALVRHGWCNADTDV